MIKDGVEIIYSQHSPKRVLSVLIYFSSPVKLREGLVYIDFQRMFSLQALTAARVSVSSSSRGALVELMTF